MNAYETPKPPHHPTAIMRHALSISHIQPTGYTYGGPVYRKSLGRVLQAAFPGLALDECFLTAPAHGLRKSLSQLVSLARSLASPLPAKVVHFRSHRSMDLVKKSSRQHRYWLILINNAEMLWCLDMLPDPSRAVCVAHNVEHLLYREQVAPLLRLPALGRLLLRDTEKLRSFEMHMLARVGRIITVSEEDRRTLLALQPDLQAVAILPSFDTPVIPHRDPTPGGEVHLAFLGNHDWWPNRRSIEWYLHSIHPSVTAPVTLHLFGRGSDRYQGIPRVVAHGFVEDVSEVWRTADIMIQPITAGAGINIKVAESLYNRMPVLATTRALRGMPLVGDEAIAALDNPSEWIDFLNSPALLRLKGKIVLPENAILFSISSNAELLRSFLMPLIEES